MTPWGAGYLAVAPEAGGAVRSALGLVFEAVARPEGARLRVTWDGGALEC